MAFLFLSIILPSGPQTLFSTKSFFCYSQQIFLTNMWFWFCMTTHPLPFFPDHDLLHSTIEMLSSFPLLFVFFFSPFVLWTSHAHLLHHISLLPTIIDPCTFLRAHPKNGNKYALKIPTTIPNGSSTKNWLMYWLLPLMIWKIVNTLQVSQPMLQEWSRVDVQAPACPRS